ncbi:hypothetical protein [Metapseudomonas resinovorans]|uniref:hypothetical protein n=1 Tax=Metapseudomonas resinovorans TaxID=53412 RepID=UPI00138AADF3|nr:hypothetical protein [Pseudomonas resinovorans]
MEPRTIQREGHAHATDHTPEHAKPKKNQIQKAMPANTPEIAGQPNAQAPPHTATTNLQKLKQGATTTRNNTSTATPTTVNTRPKEPPSQKPRKRTASNIRQAPTAAEIHTSTDHETHTQQHKAMAKHRRANKNDSSGQTQPSNHPASPNARPLETKEPPEPGTAGITARKLNKKHGDMQPNINPVIKNPSHPAPHQPERHTNYAQDTTRPTTKPQTGNLPTQGLSELGRTQTPRPKRRRPYNTRLKPTQPTSTPRHPRTPRANEATKTSSTVTQSPRNTAPTPEKQATNASKPPAKPAGKGPNSRKSKATTSQ